MLSIGEPCIPSKVVESVEDALEFAHEIEYPVVVRPAYTLGGTGGGFVHSDDEMREFCEYLVASTPRLLYEALEHPVQALDADVGNLGHAGISGVSEILDR